jgi:diguanylate cyclase (GGDEF)-like protein
MSNRTKIYAAAVLSCAFIVVVSIAFVLAANAMVSARILNDDARSIADHWVSYLAEEQEEVAAHGRIADDLAQARAAGPLLVPREELRAFHRSMHITSIDGFAVFEADGSVTMLSEGLETDPAAGVGPAVREAFDTGRTVSVHSGEGETTLLVPMPAGQDVVRVVRVDLDQATTGGMITDALRSSSFLTAGAVAIVLLIAIGVLLWRIRDRLRSEEQIRFLAHHDPLTRLPNRVKFDERLAYALDLTRQRGGEVGLVLASIDNFGEINDSYGHLFGDAVIREAGRRLESIAADIGFAARLSGAEFALLISSSDARAKPVEVARAISKAFAKPISHEERTTFVTLSFGMAVGPQDGDTPVELVRSAGVALYRAKEEGRASWRVFEEGMDEALRRRVTIEQGLRVALERGEFRLFYQPQYDIGSRQLTGYEALIRWQHPEEGLRYPGEFIAIAEESGLIEPIGEWVIEQACRDAGTWDRPLTVAVNISAAQFRGNRLEDVIRRALRESGLPPQRLEIEITESILLADTEHALALLSRVQKMGVRIAMDDFGTGYSSLSYLTRFPFNKIKIDQGFVQALGVSPQVDSVVATIVGLGRSLDVSITAEGIETEEQLMLLRAAGCQFGQGYLFGRPEPLADAEPLARAANA